MTATSKDCTKCKHFVYCDFAKMYFHKVTGEECDEFKEDLTDGLGKGN